MQPVKRTGLEQELHTLVTRLCAAPPGGRAQVFTELVQVACLVMQLEQEAGLRPAGGAGGGAAGAEGAAGVVVPFPGTTGAEAVTPVAEPVPFADAAEAAPAPDPVPDERLSEPGAPPALEGPFVRLSQGGKLLHAEGVHDIPEADVVVLRFQHGDIVRAVPTAEGYQYAGVCPAPLVKSGACEQVGPVMEADDDVALLCLSNGDRVVVPTREIEAKCKERLVVVTVAYWKDARWGTKFAGRVLKVHQTGQAPAAPAPKGQRRKRQEEADSDSGGRPGTLPQFAPIEGRRPVIAVVGGQPQLRARFEAILEEYGADYRSLPYSPSDDQIETAVKASDLIIGVPKCCRTGHWESVKKYARSLGRLWLPARSHNESGFRQQVETELIPQWRRWLDETGRA